MQPQSRRPPHQSRSSGRRSYCRLASACTARDWMIGAAARRVGQELEAPGTRPLSAHRGGQECSESYPLGLVILAGAILAIGEARGVERLMYGLVAIAVGWYLWKNPDYWRRGPSCVLGYRQRRNGRAALGRRARPLRAGSGQDSSWLVAYRVATRGCGAPLALAGVVAVVTAFGEF